MQVRAPDGTTRPLPCKWAAKMWFGPTEGSVYFVQFVIRVWETDGEIYIEVNRHEGMLY